MRLQIAILGYMLVTCAGCATTMAPAGGVVADGREARLCVDDGALRVGQALRVERDVCRRDPQAPERVRCELEPVGAGAVVRLVDARCAVVRIDAATSIGRGDRISIVGAPARDGTAVARVQ